VEGRAAEERPEARWEWDAKVGSGTQRLGVAVRGVSCAQDCGGNRLEEEGKIWGGGCRPARGSLGFAPSYSCRCGGRGWEWVGHGGELQVHPDGVNSRSYLCITARGRSLGFASLKAGLSL